MKKIHRNVTNTICTKYESMLTSNPTWNCTNAKKYFDCAVKSYLIENENRFLKQLNNVRDDFYLQVGDYRSWGKRQLVKLLRETLNQH